MRDRNAHSPGQCPPRFHGERSRWLRPPMGERRECRCTTCLLNAARPRAGARPSPLFSPRARAHARAHIECRASIPGVLRACVHPTRPAAWCACGHTNTQTPRRGAASLVSIAAPRATACRAASPTRPSSSSAGCQCQAPRLPAPSFTAASSTPRPTRRCSLTAAPASSLARLDKPPRIHIRGGGERGARTRGFNLLLNAARPPPPAYARLSLCRSAHIERRASIPVTLRMCMQPPAPRTCVHVQLDHAPSTCWTRTNRQIRRSGTCPASGPPLPPPTPT